MSEISSSFELYFEDSSQISYVRDGIVLISNYKKEESIKHFKKKSKELASLIKASSLGINYIEISKNTLSGTVVAGTTFDTEEFLKYMAMLGCKFSLTHEYNDQVGEDRSFAFVGLERVKSSVVKSLFMEYAPSILLKLAIDSYSKKKLSKLIKKGVDLDVYIGYQPALIYALEAAFEDHQYGIVKKLLEAGANPNSQTHSDEYSYDDEFEGGGMTALHVASYYPSQKAIKLIANYSVDPNIQDKSGYVALHHYIEEGGSELIDFYIDLGTDTTIKNNEGNTPLQLVD